MMRETDIGALKDAIQQDWSKTRERVRPFFSVIDHHAIPDDRIIRYMLH